MPKENEGANESAENEEALYDAVTDAVDEVTYHEKVEGEDDGTDNTGDGDNESVSGDGAAGGDESDVPSDRESGAESEGNEEDETEGKSSDEDGDGESEEADGAEAGDGDSKDGDKSGDEEESGDDSAGDADHLNDPIPEGTNDRTRQRIQSLISDVKELSTAKEERDTIMAAIQDSGATPDQYAGAITVLKLYNSDSADDKRKALEVIRNMERDLAFDVGEGHRHVKLTDHADLQADVEAGALSEERALELAAVRERDKRAADKAEQRRTQEQSTTQTQQLVERGKSELNQLGQELMADPAYKAVYPQFTRILQTTLRRVHPSEWRAVAKETFDQLKANYQPPAAPANEQPTGGQKPRPQPLRPKSGSSGSGKKSEADSALDAMNDALEDM